MAAAAILDCGYQAFLGAMDGLLFEVATFLPFVVNCGKKLGYGLCLTKFKMVASDILEK
jgi:hypothetical protein